MTAPTFGYLASITPSKKLKTVLHVAPASKLVQGKITVTHKNPCPVRIRIGVSSGSLTTFSASNYIIYDLVLDPGESYESDVVYYGNNQSLVVFSDFDNTSFIINGEQIDNPVNSGFLASSKIITVRKNLSLFTVPAGREVNLSVFATNQGPNQARMRIGVSDTGTTLPSSNYLEYETQLNPRSTYQRTDIKMSGGQSLIVYGDTTDLSFAAYGKFNFNIVATDLSVNGNLNVLQNATIQQDLSVGDDLYVTGTSEFVDNVTLNKDLSVYGGLFVGPNNAPKFTVSPTTGNLVSSGSLTLTGGITATGNLSINNKFTVASTSGDTTIAGNISLSGGITSNLNVLNNRVINIAEPTSSSDAATRKYVDNKSIALAIALS